VFSQLGELMLNQLQA